MVTPAEIIASANVTDPERFFMTVMTKHDDEPKKVPFAMLSERWAQRIHSQTLSRLNERGGMSPYELILNIEKVDMYKYPHDSTDRPHFIEKLKKYIQLYENGEY